MELYDYMIKKHLYIFLLSLMFLRRMMI